MQGIYVKRTKNTDKLVPPKWLTDVLPTKDEPIYIGCMTYLIRQEVSKQMMLKIVSTLKKRGFKVQYRHTDDISATIIVPNGWEVVIDYLFGNIKLYLNPDHYGKKHVFRKVKVIGE